MKQTINPIGQEINTLGKVINNKELMLVHLHLKSGEQIVQAPFYISPAKLV